MLIRPTTEPVSPLSEAAALPPRRAKVADSPLSTHRQFGLRRAGRPAYRHWRAPPANDHDGLHGARQHVNPHVRRAATFEGALDRSSPRARTPLQNPTCFLRLCPLGARPEKESTPATPISVSASAGRQLVRGDERLLMSRLPTLRCMQAACFFTAGWRFDRDVKLVRRLLQEASLRTEAPSRAVT